jgi:hypothetical protein
MVNGAERKRPRRLALLTLALLLATAAPAETPAPQPFTIAETIEAEPAPLLTATEGLLSEWTDEVNDAPPLDDAVEEAYEDAVEMARSARPD